MLFLVTLTIVPTEKPVVLAIAICARTIAGPVLTVTAPDAPVQFAANVIEVLSDTLRIVEVSRCDDASKRVIVSPTPNPVVFDNVTTAEPVAAVPLRLMFAKLTFVTVPVTDFVTFVASKRVTGNCPVVSVVNSSTVAALLVAPVHFFAAPV